MTPAEELQKACKCLYLQVPESVADSIKEKADAVIAQLEQEQFYIECLHVGGVDNWEWYGDSLAAYYERYDD